MASYCGSSVDFHTVRFTALTATGEEQYGANAQAVTTGVSLGVSPQTISGNVSEQKNGRGVVCARKQGPDAPGPHNLTLQTCLLEPELHYLIAGGAEIENTSTEVIGWAERDPASAAANGTVVEAWSLAYEGEEQMLYKGALAYWEHVWGRVRWTLGDINLVEGVHVFTWNGIATPNGVLGRGPENDWPEAIDGAYAYWMVNSVPSTFCGSAANAS